MSKKLLHLKNDIIFKMLFADPKNKDILRDFLSVVIDLPEEEYDVIEIIDPHLRVSYADEKLGILDVHIKTKSSHQIDVEIQVSRTPYVRERIAGYAGKMLGTQLFVGEKYVEMKKVVSVIILDYNLIKDSDCFHNTYMLYDAKTQSLFTDIMEIHTLELKKLSQAINGINTTGEHDEKLEKLILWLSLINAENEEEINMLATKDPYIKEACRVLGALSDSEEVRLLYESREKAIRDEQARLYVARRDGMEESATNIAKTMRSKGYPIGAIHECTGLSESVILSL
ncbi:hypothetical protein FACS1894187_07880 [Synergistales bacterium]|nr:hypothetical protein FACS1894187_07880 [Synergistales bacterium]